MFVFHIWSPIELFLICLYFNEQIKYLKRFYIGYLIGGLGAVLAIINLLYIQPITTINSVFLLYEGFSVIALCLYSFYVLVYNEDDIINNPHFWFTTILLVYWSSVYVYWGMFPFFLTTLRDYSSIITFTLRVITILSYFGFALVFLNYKKMTVNGG